MARKLTSRSFLELLRREAKRWLRQLRSGDAQALARFRTSHPHPPSAPALRDVQLALAREHGVPGWTDLRAELERRARQPSDERRAWIQELLSAADAGDAARVRAVLQEHPDVVNERAELEGHVGKRSALHFAMNSLSTAVTDVLLSRGADPNIRDDGDNAMPIHFAAEKGNLGIVRTLIEHGADPVGAGDTHELEVIGWATCFDDLHRDVAEYLLAHGARHTIFSAVAMGDAGAIRSIGLATPGQVDRGMDRTNRRGRPLHLAVRKKQVASLDALIALGADVDARDAAGLTPLDHAALLGELDLVERLLAAGATVELPAAVALGRRDDVDRLLRADPHCLRPGGRWQRLIIRAAEQASGEVIETLIRAGASVHVRDSHQTAIDGTHGFTALHAAAWNGNESAVRVLLRYGADPAAREDKWRGTPAGWADYNKQARARDFILEGAIDIWDAIQFRPDRIGDVLARDPDALERPFRQYVNVAAVDEGHATPLAAAVIQGKADAVRILLHRGANTGWRDPSNRSLVEIAEDAGHTAIADLLRSGPPLRVAASGDEERVARFLRWACLDWRSAGDTRVARMHDAGRLLDNDPGIALANIHTAVACGEIGEVRRILAERPEAATQPGGPHGWPPLLYLCAARLPLGRGAGGATGIARLLLDHGADPNAFYLGGNADIHYTAFTCVMGRGEELGLTHPDAPELVALLLERGADPHDNQVIYQVFADNTSRSLLDEDMIWLLELMHEHSLRRGFAAQWDDPTWPMFDMRGAPSLGDESVVHHGAHVMLHGPVDRNLPRLGEWMLRHGAGPNTPFGNHPRASTRTLYQEALARGHHAMAELLVRYGARPDPLPMDDRDSFIDACLRADRARAQALLERHPGFRSDPRLMHAAIDADRDDALRLMLDAGFSPNLGEHDGMRPLHLAAAHGAERCARLLIERGAEVDARESGYDGSALTWAAHFGQRRMIELLGRHARDVWHLTYTGRLDRLREILREEPEKAQVVSRDGHTPLMWLPSDDTALSIAKLLLDHGADPSQRNDDGATAADIAERRGMLQVADLLRTTAARRIP